MKLFLKIILSIVIVFVLVAGGGMFFLTRGLDTGSKMVINNVNTTELNDGTYTGKYSAGRWTNEVSVIIKDRKITKINIVKDILLPMPEVTKNLINKVIEKQDTKVDAISGSTVTCKAYLKSIENALNK
jgi:uncharacterized protein with FMN-binding domain